MNPNLIVPCVQVGDGSHHRRKQDGHAHYLDIAVGVAELTWKQLVVLDLATEDQYWLNELASDEVIREMLPSMVRDGLVEIRNWGEPLELESAGEILADDGIWSSRAISFFATQLGRYAYFALDTSMVASLWRQALIEGYPHAISRSGGLAARKETDTPQIRT